MAVVLGVVAAFLLVLTALVGPVPASPWLRIVVVLAQWVGPLLLVAAVAVQIRQRLSAWVRRCLIDLAGPALITSMPPRTVLSAVLAHVFGDQVGHQEVVTALLGGSGRDPAAKDTAVSRNTNVQIRFERIDQSNCMSELTWSHEFSGVRNNHRLVMFATFDRDIYTIVITERVFPLFEAWRVHDEEQLDQFVSGMRDRLNLGISYRDAAKELHVVAPTRAQGEEVALADFDRFVKLPNWVDRKNLVIYQVDLHDLADPDHIVDSIERLSFRASTIGLFDQGFVSWTAPHPCYVGQVVFDVCRLAYEGEKLVYQVVVTSLKLADVPLGGTWTHVPDQIVVAIDSWMLPGHGVTLLWRPVTGSEPRDDPDRW